MIAAIYARVSTEDQSCDLQLTDLRAHAQRSGWTTVEYVETFSAQAGSKRPVLKRLLRDARLHKFDVVLVWKLDRLGRSLQQLIENVQSLDSAGVRFIVPSQGIDTDGRSPIGKFLMYMFGAFAEFERDLIAERVRAGMAEAQRRGKHFGRPKRIFPREEAAILRAQGMSWRAIESKLGVPQSTIRLSLSRTQKKTALRAAA